MADVFLGDLVTAPWSRKTFSSSGEFSDENDSGILIKVESLSGQVDDDSGGSVGLGSSEAGPK